jgi:hypothetical protein
MIREGSILSGMAIPLVFFSKDLVICYSAKLECCSRERYPSIRRAYSLEYHPRYFWK